MINKVELENHVNEVYETTVATIYHIENIFENNGSLTISGRFNRSEHLLNKITNKPCIAGYNEREIVCGDVDRFSPSQV